MDNKRELQLPPSTSGDTTVETSGSLLFIGANGAGKTRLGTWIEASSPQKDLVHRISAQKSLSMPDSTTPMSIELAENNLLWGHQSNKNKAAFKYQQKPATTLLNDYEKLMVYLFSDETESNAKFKAAYKITDEKLDAPVTKLDKVKMVWEKILPHRELIIGGLRIQTKVKGTDDTIYNSSEMSDGERVIFYLIGQSLAAPDNGIVIIDEPELHLHKSVQAPLWREIEKLRNDCLFVYLTHDVDFAAAQEGAEKIWLKSYDGTKWDWETIEQDETLPDNLLIEVLGSRKPIVFVEGENGSFDVSLYREILDDYLVVPRGSCTQVIQSVKALKANTQLHHMQVLGIIDRDRRVNAEVSSLESEQIYVLDVAEVENLFCTPEVLNIVSERLARNPAADLQAAKDLIFKNLAAELEVQVSLRVAGEIKYQLNFFDEKSRGEQALNTALQSLVSTIDVSGIYSSTLSDFNDILANKDYPKLLQVYNRKSLPSQVSSALGLSNGGLAEFVVRLARTDSKELIKNAVKNYFGGFSAHMS